jgi:hypothetical protein
MPKSTKSNKQNRHSDHGQIYHSIMPLEIRKHKHVVDTLELPPKVFPSLIRPTENNLSFSSSVYVTASNGNPPTVLPSFSIHSKDFLKPVPLRRSAARCVTLCEVLRISRLDFLRAVDEGERGVERVVRVLSSFPELSSVSRRELVDFSKRGIMRPVYEDTIICQWPCTSGAGYLGISSPSHICSYNELSKNKISISWKCHNTV